MYQPPTATAPANQTPDITVMFQQLLQGQTSMQTHITNSHTELTGKIDQLSHRVDQISQRLTVVEQQQASSQHVRTSGQLPSKSIENPRVHTIKSISFRSGTLLPTIPVKSTLTEDSDIQVGGDGLISDEEDEEKQHISTAPTLPPTPEPTKKNEWPVDTSLLVGRRFYRPREISEDERKRDRTELIYTIQTDTSKVQPSSTQQLDPSPPSQYKPIVPFPQRLQRRCADKFRSLFDKQLKEIELRIPILDAFILIPRYMQFLKEAIKGRTKELEGMQVETHEDSPLMQMSVVKNKLEDPGAFTIPCSIGETKFRSCLCDLGASISLMPLSVAKQLGYNSFKPCSISLVLADRSARSPHGLLENIPVRIGNVEVLTDFVVLDMGEEVENPLLLGRPFLASTGALIDVRSGTIELDIGTNSKLTFDIKDAREKPTIEGQTFSVEGICQLNSKPLKRPKVLMGKSSKDSDYLTKNPMYEEVVDGRSLASLFDGDEPSHSTPKEIEKLPALDLGPDIVLKPLGYVNGAMEYKVKGTSRFKPFAKVRQLLSHPRPQPEMSGPFEVKAILPCGRITLVGKKGDIVPIDGQKVKLYLVTESKRTPPPLPTSDFTVNGHRIKPYLAEERIPDKTTIALTTAREVEKPAQSELPDVKEVSATPKVTETDETAAVSPPPA